MAALLRLNSTFSIDADGARGYLQEHGWPSGVQDVCIRNMQRVPLRYVMVDDSGSMAAQDGHRMVIKKGKQK